MRMAEPQTTAVGRVLPSADSRIDDFATLADETVATLAADSAPRMSIM